MHAWVESYEDVKMDWEFFVTWYGDITKAKVEEKVPDMLPSV